MIRHHYLIVIVLFLKLRVDLVSAEQTTEDISAIIKSYDDAFTTVKPEESQFVTTRIQPKIEVHDPGFVYDFTKAKYESRPPIYPDASLVAAGSNPESTSADDYSGSSSVEESDEGNEDPKGPPDHLIPFSEHENPQEPSTRPNYTSPGDWAKPPVDKNIPLEWVPTKLYAQVRGSHTVKHLPQEEAVKSAETSEEKENAARLKEVVKESKANTVYTEEGYEDAAYDHAGQIRDADFHEDFKRKLNEELNGKGVFKGKKKKSKTYKKHKPRKYRENNRDDFAENYKSQSEVAEEARTSKQQVDPEQVKILKNALNQPAIDPKLAVESGIVELEKDLRDESLEKQRTSTEPYTYITTTLPTTYKPPATESIFQSKMDPETTTIRRTVFTIRPKKPMITMRPKIYYKPKKSLNAFSVSKNNDNYNAYSTSSYSYEPTTIDYSNMVWNYLLQNQNTTPLTYSPPYIEQQTVNPVIANPLAVATLNGHGPYLVVVTEPTDTLTQNPLESQNFESTVDFGLGGDFNVTKPIVADSYGHHNPFIPVHRQANELNYNNNPNSIYTNADVSNKLQKPHSIYTNTDGTSKLQNPYNIYTNVDNPVNYKRREMKRREQIPKFKKLKAQSLLEADQNFIEKAKDNYMQYYTPILPSKTPNPSVKYSHYKRRPFANVFDQWPETDESGKLVESNVSGGVGRPPIEPEAQKSISKPVTKLLPPSPLSTSEYATFHRQSKGIKPMPPTVMAMMPIIDAIHKHEHEQTSFPFLLRRKRSTFGFFRTPNFKPRDKKQQEVDGNENLSQSSSNDSKNTKYPANFNVLLNESPQVATKVVDDEIKGRFVNGSKTVSDDSSSNEELAKIKSNKNSPDSKENSKEVEVEVPELDFSGVFEKDEVEPTTKKPGVNTKKYPFYKDSSVLRNSALKYVVNPKQVPKKTLGGMEFYNSRIRECEEVDPNLEKIVPEDEDLVNKRGPQKKKLRLHGLGDKIDCYKAKYFDENPLDNPLFMEKQVEMPSAPMELNPKKFASRILELPSENDDYTIPKGPKNPEFTHAQRGVKLRRPLRQHVSEQNFRYHMYPKSRKPNLVSTNQQRYRYPSKYPSSIQDKIRPQAARPKVKLKTSNAKVVPRYQRLVYEDVMGNIMNLEKVKKPRIPKRGSAPFYSKHYKRDNNREQGDPGSKNLKSTAIDGLVPPPKKTSDKLMYANSNLRYNKNRYNSSDVLTKNLRIYKRSITVDDNKNLSSYETEDNVNKTDKPTFRIVFTTPQPKQISSEKQTLDSEELEEFLAKNEYNIANESPKHLNQTSGSKSISSEKQTLNSEEVKEFAGKKESSISTESLKDLNRTPPPKPISSEKQTLNSKEVEKIPFKKTSNTVKQSPRHPNRSEADPERYNKFSSHENTNTSSETLRKEPKYHLAKKRKLARDTTFASSTLIPVMVHLYDNFTARIPRGSINNHAKQQLEIKPPYNKRNHKYEVSNEEIEKPIEQPIEQEDPKKQFVTFSPIQKKNKDKPNVVTEKTYISTPNIEEHKELFQFLKGNPPGYDEAFADGSDAESIEDKPKTLFEDEDENLNAKTLPKNEEIQVETLETQESPKKEDTEDETSELEADEPDQDEEKKEVYEEESTPEDSPEQAEENGQPDGDEEKSSKDDEKDDEPFVRFSSRPYSPPENYEDEQYTDLGPRVNKPYFYHPPFDVPTYEKYELGKPVDHSGDEYGHEESEDHEKYVFPWEQDQEDDEKKEESEHVSESDRPEYPWEKRERQNKDRHKREKIGKKHSKKNYHIADHSKEASNTKFVYIPSKNKHLRGKKDVGSAQGNLYNYPSKYSSKYKSSKIKDVDADDHDDDDDDDDEDDIEKSILKYIENLETTTPVDENIHTTSLENLQNVAEEDIVTSNPLNKLNDTVVMSSNKQESSTTFSPKSQKSDTIISTTAPSTNRGRGRSRRINLISNKQNEIATTTANINHLRVLPTAPSKMNRQRGRNRGTTTSLTTTTTAKPNRRRTRLTASTTTTSTTPRTIPRTVNERRRRPFRITSYSDNRIGSTTPSALPTSTGRTVEREHRSRVSKEMIITKTVEDDDDDDEDSEKSTSRQNNKKPPSIVAQVRRSRIRHQQQSKNTTDDNNPSKKKRVEKVTITMEETPDHVYKTKEIDKDGVKGKFITITANNNSAKAEPAKDSHDRPVVVDDAEMEEIQRRMEAFKSFDSVIQDTEDLVDEPSSLRAAEKYVVGSLLQKLPLPLARKPSGDKAGNAATKNRGTENEDEDEGEDEGEEEDDDDDEDDDEEETNERDDKDAEGEDSRHRKNDGEYRNNNSNATDNNASVIKNPDNRKYYYVESR